VTNICNNLLRLTSKFTNKLFGFTNGIETSIIAINLILIGNFQRLLTKNKANAALSVGVKLPHPINPALVECLVVRNGNSQPMHYLYSERCSQYWNQ
jgi:hypothetical protein